jgi:DNA-binding XRE family transcriptional regulator
MRLKMGMSQASNVQPSTALKEVSKEHTAFRREKETPLDGEAETGVRDVRFQDVCKTTPEDIFSFSMECSSTRKLAGLTQKDVAERMGTTASAVARLETFVPGRKQAPTLNTLLRYAQALGCRLLLKFEPLEDKE